MQLTRRRLLEITVEVVIGIALVAAVIVYAAIGPFAWMPGARWWGLAAFTALLRMGISSFQAAESRHACAFSTLS